MCGIHGFNFEDQILIEKMVATCDHRGPDDKGFLVSPGISLGHNRLAILDLSEKGHQPMWSHDRTRVIVFNGEIYNYRELRDGLRSLGHSFISDSDTEVILAAYDEYGERCVEKLNGIFVFAIWDTKDHRIFLARDHIGVKPLYYWHQGERFVFSSEIKAVLQNSQVDRTVSREAFNHYFRVLYVPQPLTMFQNVFKFPPGSYGVLEKGKLTIKRYWQVSFGEYISQTKQNISEELKRRISSSVRAQLVSDRPLGLYLSGGIDSSVLLSVMSKFRGREIDTFSVGFDLTDEEESAKFNSDFELARRTADHFGTKHHEVLVSARDVAENFEDIVYHLDEPISNPTAVSMFLLSRFTKGKADVVLSGDGGDELFGGYPRYQHSLMMSQYQRTIPGFVRKLAGKASQRMGKLNTDKGIDRYILFGFQNDEILSKVLARDWFDQKATKQFFLDEYSSGEKLSAEEYLMDVNRRSWLVDYSLMLSDKMSMAHSVEQRVPLLDKDLVEFAYRIPAKYKLSFFDSKIILKEAFRDDLPGFLFDQPKRGWFSPGAKWLRHPEVLKLAKEVLSRGYCAETDLLFNWDKLNDLFESHRQKKSYHLTILWSVLTFQLWARRHDAVLDINFS